MITKKEKLIFWLAALVAVVGGAIGNMWTGSYFNMASQNYSLLSIITFSIFSGFFLFLVIKIALIIKKIEKIKRGRPRKK